MEFVEQLKSQIDIVKVIGEYVRLKRVGSTGRYLGLCPFHQEKTPSFNVNQTKQFYKCFGCGVGGDALKFVMEHDGMTFPEALRFLAERNGIPMPQRNEYSDEASRLKAALYEMHSIANEMFRSNLRGPQGAEARAYLDHRAVAQELVDHFQIGYSDSGGQALVRAFAQRKFPQEALEKSGLVRQRDSGGFYDAFRGRLMFPIHNESGKVIGFGGRAMRDGDQPKYMNSPETPIYKKNAVLYNLHGAREGMRKHGRAVLVEGYMDVIGVYAAGVREAVASCGTALTNNQVRAIHRHTDRVTVNFDPDTAGSNAAEKAIQLFLDEGMQVKVLTLDGGLDPDEFIKEYGAEVYLAKLDGASGYFHWLADRARARVDMKSPEGRMEAFEILLPAIHKVSNRLERAAVADDLASYLGVEKGMVLEELKKAAAERRAPERVAQTAGSAVPTTERMLLHAALSSARVRAEILPMLGPEWTESFVTHEIFEGLRNICQADPEIEDARLFSQLEGLLSSPAQELLHLAISADEASEEECWQQAEACLRRLGVDYYRRQAADLRRQVEQAERAGDVKEAMRLMMELRELEQSRAKQAAV